MAGVFATLDPFSVCVEVLSEGTDVNGDCRAVCVDEADNELGGPGNPNAENPYSLCGDKKLVLMTVPVGEVAAISGGCNGEKAEGGGGRDGN